VNTSAPPANLAEAERWVLEMQTKLHQWAKDDPVRRFDDLANLVYHPAFLQVAWNRVRSNKGARTAGVDKITPRSITPDATRHLSELRDQLKARQFKPQPVRQVRIPKAPGKTRALGIPTAHDRIVQASLKLVLEPIFEADFHPCSYGFRPRRRAQDAIAEIHYLTTRSYHWVFEGDIKACFDEIDHHALMGRVRDRIKDKRVLALIKAFLKAGILTADGHKTGTITGTPQGGILSPLLANIALSSLDQHFTQKWEALGPRWKRASKRRAGEPTMRLIRYADDFVILVSGTREHAQDLWGEVTTVLAPMGLRLSREKTRICHVDEGFDFLGWRIQRRAKKGEHGKRATYTYPSKKSLLSVMDKIRQLTRRERHRTLADLLRHINPVLRGWCTYFQHGVSHRTFSYLEHFTFWRVFGWLRKRHLGLNKHALVRRHLPGWEVRDAGIEMVRPKRIPITRYRYRGAKIPTPWSSSTTGTPNPAA